MRSKFRSSIVAAVAVAVTLTSFNLSPAQAAPKNTPQVANSATTDLSARRRHYRGNNNAAALAMFGIVAGGIAAAAASDRYNDGYYYGGRPYYGSYGGAHYRGGYRGGHHHGGRGFVGGHHWQR